MRFVLLVVMMLGGAVGWSQFSVQPVVAVNSLEGQLLRHVLKERFQFYFGLSERAVYRLLIDEPSVIERYIDMMTEVAETGEIDRIRLENLTETVNRAVAGEQLVQGLRLVDTDIVEGRLRRTVYGEKFLSRRMTDVYRSRLAFLRPNFIAYDGEAPILKGLISFFEKYPQLEQRLSPYLADQLLIYPNPSEQHQRYANNRFELLVTFDDLLSYHQLPKDIIAESKTEVFREGKMVIFLRTAPDNRKIAIDYDNNPRNKFFTHLENLDPTVTNLSIAVWLEESDNPTLEYLCSQTTPERIKIIATRSCDANSIFPEKIITLTDLGLPSSEFTDDTLSYLILHGDINIRWRDLLDPNLQYEPLVHRFAKDMGWDYAKIDSYFTDSYDAYNQLENYKNKNDDPVKKQLITTFIQQSIMLHAKARIILRISQKITSYPTESVKHYHMQNMTRKEILSLALEKYTLFDIIWSEKIETIVGELPNFYRPSAAISKELLERYSYHPQELKKLYGTTIYQLVTGNGRAIYSRQQWDDALYQLRVNVANKVISLYRRKNVDRDLAELLAIIPRAIILELATTNHYPLAKELTDKETRTDMLINIRRGMRSAIQELNETLESIDDND